MKRKRNAAKGLFVFFVAALLGLCLAVFAPKGHRPAHGAPPPGSGKAAQAPGKGAKPEVNAPASAAAASSAAPASSGAAAAPANPEADDLASLPLESGLPISVRAAAFYVDVSSLDDSKGEYEATTDLRLIWTDLRLAFDVSDEPRGFKEYRFSAADKKLETIWWPKVEVMNLIEDPKRTDRRLRIYADGEVELTARTTGKYKLNIDPSRFPFDRQHLKLDIMVRENSTDEVELESHHDDVEWSRPATSLSIEGWTPGVVDIDHSDMTGWNGDRYGRVEFALDVDRDPKGAIAPVFIPLVASLLIPLLAIWMNKATEEGFEIEAFELANVVIGGLFSVIALSFAVYSSYTVIAGSDNTVTRLFALNYASLAVALIVVVLFFRFNLISKLFGRYVHEELYKFVLWGMPAISAALSVAIILSARA